MRVLFLTNFLPSPHSPTGGLFITNRLKTLQSFDMNFDIYGITYKDTFGVKLLKKIPSNTNGNVTDSFYEVNGVKYKYATLCRNVIDIFNSRVIKKSNQIKDSKEVADDLFYKIRGNEFDIIHAHGMYEPPAGLVAKLLSQKLSVPYVVTCHGSDINLAMPKAKELYLDVLENAAKVIFVSNALLNKAKSFGYTGKNSVVIPNGIEPDIFKPLDKEKVKKELGLSKKVVGFVGGLKKVKRADKLPEIFFIYLRSTMLSF